MVSEQFISVVQGLDNYDILCRHLLANITLFKDDRVSCYITLAAFTVVLFLSHLVSRLVFIFRKSKLFCLRTQRLREGNIFTPVCSKVGMVRDMNKGTPPPYLQDPPDRTRDYSPSSWDRTKILFASPQAVCLLQSRRKPFLFEKIHWF